MKRDSVIYIIGQGLQGGLGAFFLFLGVFFFLQSSFSFLERGEDSSSIASLNGLSSSIDITSSKRVSSEISPLSFRPRDDLKNNTNKVSSPHIDRLLIDLRNKSPQIKVIENEKASELISSESGYLIFNMKGFLETNYTDQESPPTSPFSTASTRISRYNLGMEKIWESGIKTELSYSLQNREQSFFSGLNQSFLTPTVQISFLSHLFQDIFRGRYRHLSQGIIKKSKFIEMERLVDQKNILAQGLLNFSRILIQEEELKFQESLCGQVNVQSKKLAKKMKRQSISKRDYYISLRESTKCQVAVEEVKNSLIERKQSFESTFHISYKSYIDFNAKTLFKELERSYDVFRKRSEPFRVELKGEVRAISLELESLKMKEKELYALAEPDLQLELKAGATGLGSNFGASHGDVGSLKFPFMSIGLRMGLPWSRPESKSLARSHSYEVRAKEAEKRLLVSQSLERFESLKLTLRNDFSIYSKYQRAVQLSNFILKEARNDFNNGRIDFFTLTEFNKALIQDQKILSVHRIRLLTQVVEYLDYHNYFNKYLLAN